MRADKRDVTIVLVLCLSICSLGRAAKLQSWQQWQAPVPLEEVNTSGYNDKSPFLSSDGLTLYFSRENESAGYFACLFQATRDSLDEPFADVREITSLTDDTGHVSCPWVSPDGLRLYYYSTSGMTRFLRMSQRSNVRKTWSAGSYLSELNSLGSVANPSLTQDELTIVFSGLSLAGGHGDWDLWMATRPNREADFGNVTNLGPLNTSSSDMHPSLSPDGLVLYFGSNRSGRFQIFRAWRSSRQSLFGHVEHLAVLDTPGGISTYPAIAEDGTALYYGSQPGSGLMDIWVSYAGPTFYVDAEHGRDWHNGRRPSRALATIQRAIELAQPGDVIGVLPGVYRQEVRFMGKAVTVRSIGDAAIIQVPGGIGASFYMREGPQTILRNVIIHGCDTGILCTESSPTITNVTVVGNLRGAEVYGRAVQPNIRNSIFWDNAASDVVGGHAAYSCIQRVSQGQGNFRENPLFVDPQNGDYHVRSARGRYWPEHEVWVLDDVSSPCIDAGDPAADFSDELEPNGGRLNVGAHGGTAYAEMSEPPFDGDINADGLFDMTDFNLFMDLWEQAFPQPRPTR